VRGRFGAGAWRATRSKGFCEAAGIAPQLGRIANPFGATVMSGGGFDSLPDKYNCAAELAGHDRPTKCFTLASAIRPALTCSWPSWRTWRGSPGQLGGQP
jgi:hypothetical protein